MRVKAFLSRAMARFRSSRRRDGSMRSAPMKYISYFTLISSSSSSRDPSTSASCSLASFSLPLSHSGGTFPGVPPMRGAPGFLGGSATPGV